MNIIKNNKQLEITKAWIEEFKEELKQLIDDHCMLDDTLIDNIHYELQYNALQGMIKDLEEQIRVYENVKMDKFLQEPVDNYTKEINKEIIDKILKKE